jgi:hypothetical protein
VGNPTAFGGLVEGVFSRTCGMGEGSSLTYVHEAASPTEKEFFTYRYRWIYVNQGQFTFVDLQSWGKHIWNFHKRARVAGCKPGLDFRSG